VITSDGKRGDPPRMTDPARGNVTGEALIFDSRDDSVSVEGGTTKTETTARGKGGSKYRTPMETLIAEGIARPTKAASCTRSGPAHLPREVVGLLGPNGAGRRRAFT